MQVITNVRKETVVHPASTLGDLKDYIGRTFITSKNGQETLVTLVKVKSRVYLAYTKSKRKDLFTESLAKFREYYGLLASVTLTAESNS